MEGKGRDRRTGRGKVGGVEGGIEGGIEGG
jgi:hypothetical protein